MVECGMDVIMPLFAATDAAVIAGDVPAAALGGIITARGMPLPVPVPIPIPAVPGWVADGVDERFA